MLFLDRGSHRRMSQRRGEFGGGVDLGYLTVLTLDPARAA
jgi:hypothetical protein